ncbi:hypothetical protein BDQ17DRAFT_1366509 [Cyathus striatus]|nr:hypothetical protein BDQ17DRAFT_1366509 [Cyathus striatus]
MRNHLKHAENPTLQSGVVTAQTDVDINTNVYSVGSQDMGLSTAEVTEHLEKSEEPFGSHPSYLRGLQRFSSSFSLSPVVSYTYHAKPPLNVPPEVQTDPVIHSVIDSNPSLFAIVTPINVDVFECYVSSHPNRPFTLSVCEGLQHGFWSQASYCPNYPPSLDVSDQHPPQSQAEQDFLYSQRDQEACILCLYMLSRRFLVIFVWSQIIAVVSFL